MASLMKLFEEIDQLELRLDLRLPEDLKAIYRRYSTVRLFNSESGATYRFVPVFEIRPTRIDIYGLGLEDWGLSPG